MRKITLFVLVLILAATGLFAQGGPCEVNPPGSGITACRYFAWELTADPYTFTQYRHTVQNMALGATPYINLTVYSFTEPLLGGNPFTPGPYIQPHPVYFAEYVASAKNALGEYRWIADWKNNTNCYCFIERGVFFTQAGTVIVWRIPF